MEAIDVTAFKKINADLQKVYIDWQIYYSKFCNVYNADMEKSRYDQDFPPLPPANIITGVINNTGMDQRFGFESSNLTSITTFNHISPTTAPIPSGCNKRKRFNAGPTKSKKRKRNRNRKTRKYLPPKPVTSLIESFQDQMAALNCNSRPTTTTLTSGIEVPENLPTPTKSQYGCRDELCDQTPSFPLIPEAKSLKNPITNLIEDVQVLKSSNINQNGVQNSHSKSTTVTSSSSIEVPNKIKKIMGRCKRAREYLPPKQVTPLMKPFQDEDVAQSSITLTSSRGVKIPKTLETLYNKPCEPSPLMQKSQSLKTSTTNKKALQNSHSKSTTLKRSSGIKIPDSLAILTKSQYSCSDEPCDQIPPLPFMQEVEGLKTSTINQTTQEDPQAKELKEDQRISSYKPLPINPETIVHQRPKDSKFLLNHRSERGDTLGSKLVSLSELMSAINLEEVRVLVNKLKASPAGRLQSLLDHKDLINAFAKFKHSQ